MRGCSKALPPAMERQSKPRQPATCHLPTPSHLLGQLRQNGGGQLLRVSHQHHAATIKMWQSDVNQGKHERELRRCLNIWSLAPPLTSTARRSPLGTKHQWLQRRHFRRLARLINQHCSEKVGGRRARSVC